MYSTSWSSIWSLWYSISSASEFFSVSSCDWFCNKKILSNQLLNSNDYSYMYDKTNHPSITILQLFSNGQTDNKLEYCVNPGPVPTCCAIIHLNCSLLGVLFQSVAVSTMRRQSARPEAFLHAEERPMFRGLRSASTERNQVWLGLPAGLLQSVSVPTSVYLEVYVSQVSCQWDVRHATSRSGFREIGRERGGERGKTERDLESLQGTRTSNR